MSVPSGNDPQHPWQQGPQQPPWQPQPPQQQTPPPPPNKKKGLSTGRKVGLGCFGSAVLAIVIIVIAAIASNGGAGNSNGNGQASKNTPTPTATAAATPTAAPTSKPAATPKAPTAPTVLIAQVAGDNQPGQWNSPTFDAPSHWKFTYSFDCTSFGYQGNFQVYLFQGSNLVDPIVNDLAMTGGSTQDEYDSGSNMHIEVNTECSTWSVSATSAPIG